jgi:D-alanyl-D-alanine carboxypeptidase
VSHRTQHERTRIDLDEPISTYLPRSLITGIHRVDGIDRSHEITVRNLVSHTSGLADYLIDAPKGKPSLWDRLMTEDDQRVPVEEATRIVRDEPTPTSLLNRPMPSGRRRTTPTRTSVCSSRSSRL